MSNTRRLAPLIIQEHFLVGDISQRPLPTPLIRSRVVIRRLHHIDDLGDSTHTNHSLHLSLKHTGCVLLRADDGTRTRDILIGSQIL